MNVRAWCQPRWLLSSLLIAGAALFAIGVTSERAGEDDHGSSESVAELNSEQADEAGEGEAAEEGTGDNEAAEGSEESAEGSEESEEGLFGLNLESPVFVVLGVAASLALAALTWRSNARRLLIVTGLFAAVFAVLDVAEAVRKFNDSETGIAVLAMTIGVIHAAAAFVADQRLPTTES